MKFTHDMFPQTVEQVSENVEIPTPNKATAIVLEIGYPVELR
jgi:hypothetical protein